MNWRALWRDPAVLLATILLVSSGFSAAQNETGNGSRWAHPPYEILALAAIAGLSLARKASEASDESERAFWQWLAAGCGFFIASVAVSRVFARENASAAVIAEALDITFRMAIFAAIGMRPHLQSLPAINAQLQRVRFLSFLVFSQALIVYFAVIPSPIAAQATRLHPATTATLILDAALAIGFWLFSLRVQTGRWRIVYRLACIGFAAAAGADIFLASLGPGHSADLNILPNFFRLLLFIPLIFASRAQFRPPIGPLGPATSGPGLEETIGVLPAAFYAFAFAAIHLTIEATGALPAATEYARSVITIICLVLLAAVSLREKILSIQGQLRGERKIQESERFFELVFQNTPGPCFVCDLQGRLRLGNRALEELTGYSIAELTRTDLAGAGLLPSNDLGESRRGRREEFILKRKDGRFLPIELQFFFIRRGGQRLALGVARDLEAQKLADKEKQRIQDELERRVISRTAELGAANQALTAEIAERKKSESALRNSEAKLRSIIDADPECVQMLDAANRLLLINPAGMKIFEAGSAAKILGRNADEWVAPEFRDAYRQALHAGRGGQQQSIEYEYITLGGRRRWMKSAVVALQDPENLAAAHQLLLLSKDTTEHRRMQHQLLESQKTGIIGRMAGGVAHEFNNLLTVIKGHAELLAELQKNEMERHSTREILDACRTAAAFTRQLLAVGQKQLIVPEITDANSLLQSIANDLSGLFKKNLVFAVQAEAQRASILVDPRQLRQLILLLAHHAQENLARGSTFQIRTCNGQPSPAEAAKSEDGREFLLIRTTFAAYSKEMISVQTLFDILSEPGVESLSRLDLAAVRGTVEQSGGRIFAECTGPGDLIIVMGFPVHRGEEFPAMQAASQGEAQSPHGEN